KLIQPFIGFAISQRAVDKSCCDPALNERIHLILHKRNQRGDDEGHTIDHHSRKLIAERLAAPGRHHHYDVSTVEHRVDYLSLSLTKVGEAEVSIKGLRGPFGIVHGYSSRESARLKRTIKMHCKRYHGAGGLPNRGVMTVARRRSTDFSP